MSIVIAGGGIGGLTAALSLHAAGITDVSVAEAALEVQPIGVGINLPPHAVRELTELGLGDGLASLGAQSTELAYYDPMGELIWSEPRGLAADYRWPQYSVHRGKLQQLLAEAVVARFGPDAVQSGMRITGFHQHDGGVTCEFQNRRSDTTASTTASLLIGADGIRSSVRRVLRPDEGPLSWSGWLMWRGVTWAPSFLSGTSMVIVGDEVQRVVAYPISGPRADGLVLVNWILSRRTDETATESERGNWTQPADKRDLVQYVDSMRFDWLDIASLIGNAEAAYEYPKVDLEPLDRWTDGRVTLLGDAAHAMYPFGSNGASQAIIDARVLALELATHDDEIEALASYEEARRPVTTQVQLANRRQDGEVMTRVSELARGSAVGDAADELKSVEVQYKRLAGFEAETLNTRPSLSVPGREK
ncbi:2-polyprenyl-6-methoxyphenol hydroxylase-like FAD-dependent oxidoreductase [Antricoccus suffuscus]|uniref:2-polyprenyl-6-methoxyphenol hydroxylase-like FAD-dependent oxidoreductase n=1 Tax=Antricoccus suffuscus TaxID=1629062 RepID=A0A2T1A0E5_9ACTN|nr:flavin-dependent oxidoreductase [Antricoccus suffuscus]PRZ42073.1 2-polyprenyl-6-methoxyphenol hydroxylase-like FAD-dependent oxidoreductase [Antricoccus suffuscus]